MFPIILTRVNLIGALNQVNFKTQTELDRTIKNSEKCVVFFGFEDSKNSWLNFPINYFKDKVTFIRSTAQDGIQYNCTKSSIIAFANGEKYGKRLKRYNTIAFVKWIDRLIHSHGKTISSPEVLRQLLHETTSLTFIVDTDKPEYLQNTFTYYCSRAVFAVLNIEIDPGIYYFRGCDRQLIEIKDNNTDLLCPIDDLSILDVSQKPYICGFLFDSNTQNEEYTIHILHQVREKYGNLVSAVLFSSPYANYYLERAKTQKIPRPAFVVLNTKNYSQGKWFTTENITDEKSILQFVNRTIHNLENYSYVSKSNLDNYGPLYEIGYREFKDSVVESNYSVLVAITASWCNHCQNMKRILNATAEVFIGTNTKLFFLDADENDIPEDVPEFDGYPTLFLWTENSKSNPIEFKGKRSIESIIDFILQNTSETELLEYSLDELKKKYEIL